MTDFKARARELAKMTDEKMWVTVSNSFDYVDSSVFIESALLQFGREILEAEPTPDMVEQGMRWIRPEHAAQNAYSEMSAVRAKELE